MLRTREKGVPTLKWIGHTLEVAFGKHPKGKRKGSALQSRRCSCSAEQWAKEASLAAAKSATAHKGEKSQYTSAKSALSVSRGNAFMTAISCLSES